MAGTDRLDVVNRYMQMIAEDSRAAAAQTFLSANARITINGEELTRAEYVARMEESDRLFVPRETDVHRTIIQDETIGILAESHLTQVETAYGVEPSDESWSQYYAVFHRVVDGEIVELDVVTDRATRLQQLGLLSEDPRKEQLKNQYYEVLNRVLRHDLRNGLNVVRLYADALADGAVDDNTATGEKIRERVDTLLKTTDKARGLEQLAIDTALEPTTVHLGSLVSSIVEGHAQRTDATMTTHVGDTVEQELTTDKTLLWNALGELLENAVVYGGEEPTVTVRVDAVDRSRYAAQIRVEDDGPGIPNDVLTPVLENEETELFHGSGIGLWIAKWCVTRLDGEMVVDRPESGGTCVRLLLPELG